MKCRECGHDDDAYDWPIPLMPVIDPRLAAKLFDREATKPLRVGDVITIRGTYLVNPDPNMQRTGDEPV